MFLANLQSIYIRIEREPIQVGTDLGITSIVVRMLELAVTAEGLGVSWKQHQRFRDCATKLLSKEGLPKLVLW